MIRENLGKRYEEFKKLTASEQNLFAEKNPLEVCQFVWLLEGMLSVYEKGYDDIAI